MNNFTTCRRDSGSAIMVALIFSVLIAILGIFGASYFSNLSKMNGRQQQAQMKNVFQEILKTRLLNNNICGKAFPTAINWRDPNVVHALHSPTFEGGLKIDSLNLIDNDLGLLSAGKSLPSYKMTIEEMRLYKGKTVAFPSARYEAVTLAISVSMKVGSETRKDQIEINSFPVKIDAAGKLTRCFSSESLKVLECATYHAFYFPTNNPDFTKYVEEFTPFENGATVEAPGDSAPGPLTCVKLEDMGISAPPNFVIIPPLIVEPSVAINVPTYTPWNPAPTGTNTYGMVAVNSTSTAAATQVSYNSNWSAVPAAAVPTSPYSSTIASTGGVQYYVVSPQVTPGGDGGDGGGDGGAGGDGGDGGGDGGDGGN